LKKILLIGNVNNHFFNLATQIKHYGFDCKLILLRKYGLDNPCNINRFANWVNRSWITDLSEFDLWGFDKKFQTNVNSLKKNLSTIEDFFDLVITSDYGHSLIKSLKKNSYKKHICFISGSDLTHLANPKYFEKMYDKMDLGWLVTDEAKLFKNSIENFCNEQRQSIKHADGIISYPKGSIEDERQLLDSIKPKTRFHFHFPLINYNLFKFTEPNRNSTLTIFYCARVQFLNTFSVRDNKGSLLFLDAVLKLSKKTLNFEITIFDKGNDLDIFKEKIDAFGLTNKFKWVKNLPLKKYAKYLSKADVVIDNLNPNGVPGGVSFQAAAVGRIAICNYNDTYEKEMVNLPFLKGTSPEVITDYLVKIYSDLNFKKNMSLKAFEFVKNSLPTKKYVDYLDSILKN